MLVSNALDGILSLALSFKAGVLQGSHGNYMVSSLHELSLSLFREPCISVCGRCHSLLESPSHHCKQTGVTSLSTDLEIIWRWPITSIHVIQYFKVPPFSLSLNQDCLLTNQFASAVNLWQRLGLWNSLDKQSAMIFPGPMPNPSLLPGQGWPMESSTDQSHSLAIISS